MSYIREFEAFFRNNYPKTYWLALSIVKDEEASRDIVADSFEYMFSHGEEMTEKERISYLNAVIRNKCADHFRKLGVKDKYSQYVINSARGTSEYDYEEHEKKLKIVEETIETMTLKTKEIVNLHYMQSKKYSEVASMLGISESAVKKHIISALRTLRERLSQG